MKKNLAKWDKAIHLAIGLFFVILGYSTHWAFFIVAIYFVLIAAIGYSPLYSLVKIKSKKKK
ncbi:YgaP-like transmembrane domain [Nanoarchaeota archaeon]